MKLTPAQLDALMSGIHPNVIPDDGQLSYFGQPATLKRLLDAGLIKARRRRISQTITEYFLTEEGRATALPAWQERQRRWAEERAERERLKSEAKGRNT